MLADIYAWVRENEDAVAASLGSRDEALGRDPGSRRGGLDRRDAAARALEQAGIDHEVLVIDDASVDGTAAVVEAVAPPSIPASAGPLHPSARLRLHRALRAQAFDGDAVAVMMADGSDDPADLVRYRPARAGLRLRVRLALRPGAQVRGYRG